MTIILGTTQKTQDSPKLILRSECLDCGVFHEELCDVGASFMRLMDEWMHKHPGHQVQHSSHQRSIPRHFDDSEIVTAPWWLEHPEFKPNANIKLAFGSSAAYTMTSLNSLASDTNLLAGACSLAVDNTSNLYLDMLIGGLIKNNVTTPPTAANTIFVYAYRNYDDTPTYPDTILGTDATKTLTTAFIQSTSIKLVIVIPVSATTSQVNPWDGGGLSSYFNNVIPPLHGLFIVHNSGQALAATGNTQSYKPVYMTAV